MLSTILTTSLFLASALSASVPSPTAVDLSSSLTLASVLGIDPSGPPPSDATPVPGGFTFAAGSAAEKWVIAQLTLPATPLAARELSGMKVGIFIDHDCKGGGRYAENVGYGVQNIADPDARYNSLLLATRQIRVDEQLDLSLKQRTDACGFFQGSVTQRGTGCFNQLPFSCFRLIHR